MDHRDPIIATIKDVLEQDQRLVFAYIYGSFVRGETFRDVVVGVYLRDPADNPFGESFDVKERISRSLRSSGIDAEADLFDVKILNDAPFTFLKRVFVEGILLLGLAARWASCNRNPLALQVLEERQLALFI